MIPRRLVINLCNLTNLFGTEQAAIQPKKQFQHINGMYLFKIVLDLMIFSRHAKIHHKICS